MLIKLIVVLYKMDKVVFELNRLVFLLGVIMVFVVWSN